MRCRVRRWRREDGGAAFGSASTVDPLIDQSCGQSAWSAVEVGGGKEAEFGVAGEEESVVVGEAGGRDGGPRGGSIGLPLPSALSCRGGIRGDDDAGERVSGGATGDGVSGVVEIGSEEGGNGVTGGIGGVLVNGG